MCVQKRAQADALTTSPLDLLDTVVMSDLAHVIYVSVKLLVLTEASSAQKDDSYCMHIVTRTWV